MADTETVERARFIASNIQAVREHFFKKHVTECLDVCSGGRCLELSVSQFFVVQMIRRSGPLSMSQLAERASVSMSSATAMVDRLIEKGVLTRRHSAEDRRRVEVKLDPRADAMVAEMERNIEQIFIDLVEKIGPETARRWCEVLARVREVINEQ